MSRRERSWFRGFRLTPSVGLVALGMLFAPAALAQVPQAPCGVPPTPIAGSIPFQDITTQLGYQTIAAPTSDTMSSYLGGYEVDCEVNDNYNFYSEGPWSTPDLAGTISLPFPFGFSGIYADGGTLSTPFQVNVWANGILTFDPSVSFNPYAYPQQMAPADCSGSFDAEYFVVNNGAVSDNFGGFPFIPTYGPPNALIAPWWGDLSLCANNGSVGWLLSLDDNGAPVATIQWTNATASPAPPNCGDDCYDMIDFSSCTNTQAQPLYPGNTPLPQFTFQVRLHQNNDVDFIYGPSENLNKASCYAAAVGDCSYVSGIQSNLVFPNNERPGLMDYAIQSFNCGSNEDGVGCTPTQFPAANTSVTYHDVFRSVGPDVQVAGITPPQLFPQGGVVVVPVELSNGGGTNSTGEGTLQFYFSTGGETAVGAPFSAQSVQALQACEIDTLNFPVAIPAGVSPGPGYLIAEFVPGPESIDQTPSYASAAVIVGPPEPDLAVEGSLDFTPASVVGGQDLQFEFTVANIGEVDTAATTFGIYVSLGGAISTSDILLGSAPLPAIAAGQSIPVTASFPVPLTLISGEYEIGVIVDPSNTLREVNLSNNLGLGKKLVSITSLGPLIVTTTLPHSQVSTPYSVELIAGGGDGKYLWSLAGGTLPSGMALSKAGVISGQAASVGSSSFTVKVTDGVGHSATQSLVLEVDAFNQVLKIVTQSLPGGSTAQLYNFTLAAVGGAPPYQWALATGNGQLPVGINLVSNGTLSGEPEYDQNTTFRVTVTDTAGTVVTSPTYSLTIFSGGTLAVGSTVLPPAMLGQSYSAPLHYAGGTAPYIWTIVDVEREPASPADPGTDLGSSLTSVGLDFDPGGEIDGTPTQVGVFAIEVQLTDSESPAATANGLVLLTITATTGFSFQTIELPSATANSLYRSMLVTNALSTDTVTFYVVNTAQLPTLTSKSTLPPGLQLFSDGLFQGVPLEVGTFPFLVVAQDQTTGGLATQSFSITVNSDYTPSSGCQSAPGASAFGGLLLLGLAGMRRRARRS